jgi:hypothetical protein
MLLVPGNEPSMMQRPMSSLDECVKVGIEYMVTESPELRNIPYKQAFVCEETLTPETRI